ncbi:TPA: hypothetical protein HJN18_001741 [Escherichia coli]|nr:hypothetical protein [Escherichia coli]EFM9302417.1 hypothetical protein [Escherichia coli]HAG7545367.1 hypothetical protein [Escherichia coli]HAI3254230.1 hypothetical protein [Escherichia coli]HAI3644841.1 hypothetical protein [Escherichia coli]
MRVGLIRQLLGVFPAPAGINRRDCSVCPRHQRVPRASGDKPGPTVAVLDHFKCSPRQRG